MRPHDERFAEPLPDERPHAGAPMFVVAPVRERGRGPRVAVACTAIALLAFVAGIGVASSAPARLAPRDAAATSPSGQPSPGGRPSPGGQPLAGGASAGVPPSGAPVSGSPIAGRDAAAPPAAATPSDAASGPAGSSGFVAGFDPVAVVAALPGGSGCTAGIRRQKEVPRTRRDGPRLTFQRSWLVWCRMPAAARQAFLVGVFEALRLRVPADTYGYSATGAGGGDALFPYAESPLSGTVAVTADPAGEGFAIAFVLEEWRQDVAP